MNLDEALHDLEKCAMFDPDTVTRIDAVMRIFSLLRVYRAETQTLLSKRYRDGEVDSVALTQFQDALLTAEEDHIVCHGGY